MIAYQMKLIVFIFFIFVAEIFKKLFPTWILNHLVQKILKDVLWSVMWYECKEICERLISWQIQFWSYATTINWILKMKAWKCFFDNSTQSNLLLKD